MRGLSMDEVVKRMSGVVSKQSISKYERGLMMPSSEVLIALSNCFGLPIDYFFRDSINIGKVSFRKDIRLPSRSCERLIATANEMIERYLILEDLLAIDSGFINPLSDVAIESYDDVEKATELLRKQWSLGTAPVFSVYEVLENAGVKLLEVAINDSDRMGFSSFAEGNIPVIVINSAANHTIERKRFTALHELGHLLLNIPDTVDENTNERLCHYFAGALLCPREVIYNQLGNKRTALTIEELSSLKSNYGISVSAIIFRVMHLGIITHDYFHYFYDNYIQPNLMEDGWGGYPIQERTDRFDRLLRRAVTEQVISMSRAAELANEKLGDFREKFESI